MLYEIISKLLTCILAEAKTGFWVAETLATQGVDQMWIMKH
jgi:hypothetical protein